MTKIQIVVTYTEPQTIEYEVDPAEFREWATTSPNAAGGVDAQWRTYVVQEVATDYNRGERQIQAVTVNGVTV
jgi:hypothetical protein